MTNRLFRLARDLSLLSRMMVSFSVSFTGFVAHAIHSGAVLQDAWVLMGAIFLISAGSSAINQVQEREFDARMERTRNRPVASGRLLPATAMLAGLGGLIAGGTVIAINYWYITLLLGVFAVGWYNGLYTWLKRKTAFAVIPGAITGAIPPLMGWSAAGGHLLDPGALMMAFFFFMAQVPHFWLLLMKYGEEYHQAGFPVLTRILSSLQVTRLCYVWLISTYCSSLLLVLPGIIRPGIPAWVLGGTVLVLIGYTSRQYLVGKTAFFGKPAFVLLNVFVIGVLLIALAGL